MFFDADTHVDECEATWSYIPKASQHLAPTTIEFTERERPTYPPIADGSYGRFWFIDGRLAPRRHRLDERTGTTLETRELTDVAARLRDMDKLNVSTQVIYPTVFLHEPSQRPDVITLLHHSYNRWLADRCTETSGRLRWVAMVPYLSMPDALAEIRFAKENGAVGIFKLGIECGGLRADDPYFFPAYQQAADFDLTLCIHQGTAYSPVNKFLSPFSQTNSGETPVLEAFTALLSAKLTHRIPESLRVGFIEAGAAWLPYLLGNAGWTWGTSPSERAQCFADLGFFATCEKHEDISYLLDVVGDNDHLVIGTDYTHGDRSSVLHAHKMIMERSDIDEVTAQKITSENALHLYGLS